MAVPFIQLNAVNDSIAEESLEDIRQLFESSQFVHGPAVQRFEEQFAKYTGSRFGIGVNSGTDALLLSLAVMGVGPGDEVICPAFTFGRCGDVVARLGATPIFADVRADSYCLDPDLAMASITSRTKAVVAVHLFGQACEIDRLATIARTYSVGIVEDMRHATGARLGNRRLGSYGRFGCFSFYPTRTLGAIGDGGMITTHEEASAETLRQLRDHGRTTGERAHEMIGYNSRLDTIQALVLQRKLQELDENNLERVENARLYTRLFKGSPVVTPPFRDDLSHVYNVYSVVVPDRDKLVEHLEAKGIGHKVYYPEPLHLHPAFEYLEYKEGAFPVSEDLARRSIALPIAPGLKKHHVEEVANTVLEFYGVTTA